jgi:phage regulator Rha-like protein
MFQLTKEEAQALRFQFETSKPSKGGRRYAPYAFTEHGIVMLSSVLRSKRAVQMNILIVRAFVKLREMLASHKDLARGLEDLRRKQEEQGEQITAIIETINQLLAPEPVPPTHRIGFNADDESETGSE